MIISYFCFQLLDEIFNAFSNLWMDTKVQAKEKQELASQLYKFRTRKVKIESVVEVDISTLGKSFEIEIFNEWQELAAEEGHTEEVDALTSFLILNPNICLVPAPTTLPQPPVSIVKSWLLGEDILIIS